MKSEGEVAQRWLGAAIRFEAPLQTCHMFVLLFVCFYFTIAFFPIYEVEMERSPVLLAARHLLKNKRPKICVLLALLLKPNLEIHPKGPDTPGNRPSDANKQQENVRGE